MCARAPQLSGSDGFTPGPPSSDTHVFSWGDGSRGKLGRGDELDAHTPALVDTFTPDPELNVEKVRMCDCLRVPALARALARMCVCVSTLAFVCARVSFACCVRVSVLGCA